MHLTFNTLPISINATYKRGRNSFYKGTNAKQVSEAIAWEARAQFHGEPIDTPVKLVIGLWWGDKRKHDVDNALKCCFDALKGIVYVDDDQIHIVTVHKHHDKEHPRMEIDVELIANEEISPER